MTRPSQKIRPVRPDIEVSRACPSFRAAKASGAVGEDRLVSAGTETWAPIVTQARWPEGQGGVSH